MLSDPESNMGALVQHAFEGLTPNTLRAYSKGWDDFGVYLGFHDRAQAAMKLIRSNHGQANALVLGYRAHLLERKLQPSTINSRLAAVKSIMDRLRIMGLVTWKIEVKGFKVMSYKDTRGPGREPIAKVVAALEARDDRKALRDVAMIRLLYNVGLRRGEAAALNVEHVEFSKNRIWITGKGHLEREPVTIPEKVKNALMKWLVKRPIPSDQKGRGPVFVSLDPGSDGHRLSGTGIWKMIKGYGLGRPHGLRHTAVTEGLAKTKDPTKVQQFSRHKDLRTLMIYNDNQKDAGGEVAKLLEEDV